MKLTYTKVDELHNAYNTLPFKGESILGAAENITKLKPHLETVLTVKGKLIGQHTNGKDSISTNHKNWNKFVEEYNKTLAKEVVIEDLIKLKKADIDLERVSQVNLQGFIALLISNNLLE